MAITKIQSESLNLADTYDFTGTVTGAGGVNTPVFQVSRTGSSQSISAGADTTVQFNNVDFDSGSHWNAGTYKWTPPAGKYFFNASVSIDGASQNNVYVLYITKNSTLWVQSIYRAYSTSGFTINASKIISANGTDSFHVQVYCQTTENIGYGQRQSHFEGYKIIE